VIVLYFTATILLTPILGPEILITTHLSFQSCQRTLTMSPPIGKSFSLLLSIYVLNTHMT
jgi:hypothetical protein